RIGQALPLFEPQLPPHADFIFISIGANDCKDATPVRQWVREWQRLLQHLRHRYPSAYIVCSSIPPFRCFPSLPYPVRAFLGRRSDLMNDLLRREIASFERSSFLLIPDIMTPDYFAEDGFHPNAKAHKEWAEGIFEELKRKKALD
ncbi:MAG: SGNH/GDSL hydrolase family protein, partial [Myxococcota bacterium]|nr:SGNH/GDSL hydrolase family protein [Myxococcota bacterium]